MLSPCYYTLEDHLGHIRMACNSRRIARKLVDECGSEGICYKRKVGDAGYKKFAFMW